MSEHYHSDGESSTLNPSTQTNGAVDTLVITSPCPVPLPRELTKTEKTLWERYLVLNDHDHFGYAVGLIDAWRYRLPPTLDILESLSEGVQPSDTERQLLAVVHMLRRAFDDFDAILKLAHEMIPYDQKLLRRIQVERGVVLMAPVVTDVPEDSTAEQ